MKRFVLLFSVLLVSGPIITSHPFIGFSQAAVIGSSGWLSAKGEIVSEGAGGGFSTVSKLFAKADVLLKERKYDEVISILSGPAAAEPNDLELNILLAKAQMEKCVILKAKGDETYKKLIHVPYETAQRLHKINAGHPDPYYIAAKCLIVNDRPGRAGKNIQKAIYYSHSSYDKAEYLVVLGDFWSLNLDDTRAFSRAKEAYEQAMELRKDDDVFKKDVKEKIRKLSESSQKEKSESNFDGRD